MLLINLAHPLTQLHKEKIEQLTKQSIDREVKIPSQFDLNLEFEPQAKELIDSLAFDSEEWQTEPVLINPPTHSWIALTVLAELHGRMGYFPAVIRLRPVPDSNPPQFEVAEIINLQKIRDRARTGR